MEASLRSKGIDITDDFIITKNRQAVLDGIRTQFSRVENPTAILEGQYGSGKTAVLHRLCRELSQEQLCYGSVKVDPIEIRLNIEDTLNKFLHKFLNDLAERRGENWVVEVYQKAQRFIGLPPLTESSLNGITIALVGMDITIMSEVMHFLETLLTEYRKSTDNQRIIALIIDELENITRTAELATAGERNKLSVLLRILLDASVREYIESEKARREPKVLVIFSIPERRDLQLGRWLPPDTAERCQAVERDVNLSPDAAEFLMKKMLRLYLSHVIEVSTRNTDDVRLLDWLKQLNSAADVEDNFFTYPVMPEIHRFISHRILLAPRGSVLSFRAYQVALFTLLSGWSGERPIDMRFAIDKVSQLRFDLRNYADSVDLDSLIGEDQVRRLIDHHFRRLGEGPKHQLTELTLAGITRRTTPMVLLRYGDLPSLLLNEQILSEKAFAALCESVQGVGAKGWSVSGDTLYLDVPEILSRLEKPLERVRPEERLQELLAKTQGKRDANTVTQLFAQTLLDEPRIESNVDDNKILHVKDKTARAQLVEEFLLAFDIDKAVLSKIVAVKKGCCVAVCFKEEPATKSEDIPFSVSVVLPAPLEKQESKYEAKVRSSITEERRWREQFQPLVTAVMKRQPGSFFHAFKEAMKVMLLLPTLEKEDRDAFAQYNLALARVIFDALTLEDSEREEWIRVKLGFKRFHDITPTRKLIKVLSWLEGQETLFYASSDDVRPRLYRKFEVGLSPAPNWRDEFIAEWGGEDFVSEGRLLPFESWAEERKRLYQSVHQAMQGERLGFYEVGKLLLGDCQFSALLKAMVSLHLFLKLGKVRPFGWKLTDDSDDYSAMKVISGELLHQQELRQAGERADALLRQLILLSYECSPETRDTYCSAVKWVLERQAQLHPNAPLATIQEVGAELRKYEPPRGIRGKVLVPQELISKCPGDLVKLGEFLSKLNEIIRSESWVSFAVSAKVSSFTRELAGEMTCESLVRNILKLYGNWGQPCPEALKPDRLLIRVSQEYSSEIGRSTGWAENFVRETDEAFIDKVSKVRTKTIEENVKGICDWLEQQVCRIIKPTWKRTYSDEDEQRLRVLLQSAEASAKKEIAEVDSALRDALAQLTNAQGNLAFLRYGQSLTEHRTRLQQDATVLSQVPNALYSARFGPAFASIRAHLSEWQTFYTSAFQAQSKKINSWLKTHGLEAYRESIVQAMSKVNTPVSELNKELREQGIDPLKLLQDTQAKQLLVIFAAAEMLQALKMEVNNDSGGTDTI